MPHQKSRRFVVIALLISVIPCSAPASNWQLTFQYDPDQFHLFKAEQIPEMLKRTRSPGLAGALLRLPYQLEWLDASGQILAVNSVEIPLGVRSALEEGHGRSEHSPTIPVSGAFVLRVEGPSLMAGPTHIRLVKQPAARTGNGTGALLKVRAFEADAATFALAQTAAPSTGVSVPGPIGAVKVHDSGSDANRLVIVIMCDGFTQADLDSGRFSTKVADFLTKFFSTSPWSEYPTAVNVYRLDIVSNESGADYEDGSPSAGGTLKDTYLDASFWFGDTDRCLYLNGDGVTKAVAAADLLVGAGVWDQILVFVNSLTFGGCGGTMGVSSLSLFADEVQLHEFGHSFGRLADEYDYGSTETNCAPTTERNIDCSFSFPHVKWDVWVTPGTPIPTPQISEFSEAVGAFEGAQSQLLNKYRPMLNCRMRSLGVEFCPICKEAHILQLFNFVNLADQGSPPFGPAQILAGYSRRFQVSAAPGIRGLTYQWHLGGNALTGETNNFVNVYSGQISAPNRELSVAITHTTPLVRAETVRHTQRWTLNVQPLGNPQTIAVPATGNAGPGSPYPSSLTLGGLSGTITRMSVTLSNVSHASPDDLDILLVGPHGQKTLLVSDAGGNNALNQVTLRFDDTASGFLPDASPIVAGVFKPTAYDAASDNFDSPAPPGPYASTLSVFTGTDPNGTWSLYTMDDSNQRRGSIDGWSLNLVMLQLPVIFAARQIGNNFSLSFVTDPGASYTVEFKNTLNTPAWQPFAVLTGDGRVNTVTHAGDPGSQRFYRVRVQ